MKIIGNTVGTTTPKPNLMQTDPKKGDFVFGRDEFAQMTSGVYVGSGEMPEGYNIQIDPDGDPFDGIISPEVVQEIAKQAAQLVEVPSGGGLTVEQITALDGMFKICAYTVDASDAYKAFQTAFGIAAEEEPEEPEVTLTSISAVYSGGDVPVGTAVGDLTGVVVTAHYSDGTSKAVTGYTLNGTIGEGSNTITVSYGGKTTTFTVTGVAEEPEVPTAQDVFAWNDYSKTFDAASNLVVGDNSVSFASTQQGGYYAGIEVEAGKTYTLFFDTNNKYAGINILKNDSNQYVYGIPSVATVYGKTKDNCCTFTVDSDKPYIIFGFLCYPVDGTTISEWTNIALFEGTFTERPVSEEKPQATLTHISAVYSGGDVAVGTSVNDLTGIVVTAHYSDGSSKTLTGYTLSGTIAEGNNTVTVTYGGKTATFTVTGVAESGGSDAVNLYSGQLAGTATNVNNLHMEGNTITYEALASGSLCNVTVEGLEADKEYTIFVESTRADGGHQYTNCKLNTGDGWVSGTNLANFYPSWPAAGKNYATFTANGNTLYLFFCDIGPEVAGTSPTLTIYIYEGTLTERP